MLFLLPGRLLLSITMLYLVAIALLQLHLVIHLCIRMRSTVPDRVQCLLTCIIINRLTIVNTLTSPAATMICVDFFLFSGHSPLLYAHRIPTADHCTEMGNDGDDTKTLPELFELLSEGQPKWFKVNRCIRESPADASYVDAESGLTALHLAVRARTKRRDMRKAREDSIRTLLALYPDATKLRCARRGFTPLADACYFSPAEYYASNLNEESTAASDDVDAAIETKEQELESRLQDDARVVEMLLKSNPKAVDILIIDSRGNKGSFDSALDLHIRCMSGIKISLARTNTSKANESLSAEGESPSHASSSSAVLEMLARFCSRTQLESAIETLYACNTMSVMDLYAEQETLARRNIRQFGRQTRSSSALLASAWVWEWVLTLLRCIHGKGATAPGTGSPGTTTVTTTLKCGGGSRAPSSTSIAPFRPLHVACQIPNFPPAILMIVMRAYPNSVEIKDETGNLPLHYVASWRTRTRRQQQQQQQRLKEEATTDSNSVLLVEQLRGSNADGKTGSSAWCRKSICVTSLASEYPPATGFKNNEGKTPPELFQADTI